MNFDSRGTFGHKSITGSLCSVLYMVVCLFLVMQIVLMNVFPRQVRQLPAVQVPDPVLKTITIFDEKVEAFKGNVDKLRMEDEKVEVFAAVLDAESKNPL